MRDEHNRRSALSRSKRNRVILGVFSAVFLILFGLYIVLFTQPVSDLNSEQPLHDSERAAE